MLCGKNARCVVGECKCMDGYTGDAYYECVPPGTGAYVRVNHIPILRLSYQICLCVCFCDCVHAHLHNVMIFSWFYPIVSCILKETCNGTLCGVNAICVAGTCQCEDGYVGDPTEACQSLIKGVYVRWHLGWPATVICLRPSSWFWHKFLFLLSYWIPLNAFSCFVTRKACSNSLCWCSCDVFRRSLSVWRGLWRRSD